jgi:hypothetical protein
MGCLRAWQRNHPDLFARFPGCCTAEIFVNLPYHSLWWRVRARHGCGLGEGALGQEPKGIIWSVGEWDAHTPSGVPCGAFGVVDICGAVSPSWGALSKMCPGSACARDVKIVKLLDLSRGRSMLEIAIALSTTMASLSKTRTSPPSAGQHSRAPDR